MASEVAAKWIAILTTYFFLMAFVVSLITQISPVTVTSEVTTDSYTGCGDPRTFYEQFNPDPVNTDDLTWKDNRFLYGHIDCGKSAGVLSQTSCENIEGCSWDDPASWWQTLLGLGGVDTCTGQMNYTNLTTNLVYTIKGTSVENEDPITSTQIFSIGDVCTHSSVISNSSLCDALSCTWAKYGGVEDLGDIDIDLKPSLVGTMWKTIKDMFLFRFDYGFTNDSADALLNFFIFLLPLLGIILAIIVMVRG